MEREYVIVDETKEQCRIRSMRIPTKEVDIERLGRRKRRVHHILSHRNHCNGSKTIHLGGVNNQKFRD